ncbi:hypothetical protein Enr10x_19790 [Gimesia panareensis]|uniref:Uncharacterized protein n=1 Tax=Gimesia panareensis TaxID=2527978 RepID=A0A517Q4X7_9PLAN|nr:hypothetical protein Enr10x_19790 [Gimesia panareensis]
MTSFFSSETRSLKNLSNMMTFTVCPGFAVQSRFLHESEYQLVILFIENQNTPDCPDVSHT